MKALEHHPELGQAGTALDPCLEETLFKPWPKPRGLKQDREAQAKRVIRRESEVEATEAGRGVAWPGFAGKEEKPEFCGLGRW